MTNSEAKFHLSISEGILQISGSELFVTQQIEKFKDVILDSLNENNKSVKLIPSQQTQTFTNDEADAPNVNNKTFPNVLDFDGDQINIICNIPGSTNAEKTFKIAQIYLWAKKQKGLDHVPAEEIRKICEDHACYDANNFSSHIQKDKNTITVSGPKGGKKTCKLTFPGTSRAEELLKELNEG